MQKVFTLALFLFIFFGLSGQTIVDFENFNLSPETYVNNADPDDGFLTGGALFTQHTHDLRRI